MARAPNMIVWNIIPEAETNNMCSEGMLIKGVALDSVNGLITRTYWVIPIRFSAIICPTSCTNETTGIVNA